MSNLVQNILLLSKLDNQGTEREKEVFSLDEQIRREILASETKWVEKRLDFDVKMDVVFFQGNESMMSHVWSNLIDNAIKFSPYDGTITIELNESEGHIYFAVSNEGEKIKESEA